MQRPISSNEIKAHPYLIQGGGQHTDNVVYCNMKLSQAACQAPLEIILSIKWALLHQQDNCQGYEIRSALLPIIKMENPKQENGRSIIKE